MIFSLVALQCIGCDNDCYLDDFSETEDFSRQNPPLRLTSLLERAHKNWWPSNIRTMIIIIMGVEIIDHRVMMMISLPSHSLIGRPLPFVQSSLI